MSGVESSAEKQLLSDDNLVRIDSINKDKAMWSTELNDFLVSLDSYSPSIPEAVVKYYMEKAGGCIKDERIIKLVALATDKFLSETIYDAKQNAALKSSQAKNKKRNAVEMQELFDIDDLEKALALKQIHIKKIRRTNE